MNIRTLGDLLNITEAELLSYKNFGETSLREIKAILETKNLRLGMALEDKGLPAGEELGMVEGFADPVGKALVREGDGAGLECSLELPGRFFEMEEKMLADPPIL